VGKADATGDGVVDKIAHQEHGGDSQGGKHRTAVGRLATMLDSPQADDEQDCGERVKRGVEMDERMGAGGEY
jgi:hypothetical protein